MDILLENIKLHRSEAYFYEILHPAIFNPREQTRIKKKLATLVNNMQNNALCVDVGSGTGNLCSHLNALKMETVACDLSKDMLKWNKANHRILCDASHLPIRDGVSNLTTTYSFFHHVPNASQVVCEICRIVTCKISTLYFDHDNFNCRIVNKPKYGNPTTLVNYILWTIINPTYLRKIFEYLIYGKRRHKRACAHINFTLTDGNRFKLEEIRQLLSKNEFRVQILKYRAGSYIQANHN
jgi:ubiquinone/menaquinone biosynthesis C-methylase UbiE